MINFFGLGKNENINYEKIKTFKVDIKKIGEYNKNDLIEFIEKYEKQRKILLKKLYQIEKKNIENSKKDINSIIENVKKEITIISNKKTKENILFVCEYLNKIQSQNKDLKEEILEMEENVKNASLIHEQSSLFIEENEKFEMEIEKYKNLINVLKIELQESHIKINNERTLKEMAIAKSEENVERIEELKREISLNMDKLYELENINKEKIEEISKIQKKLNFDDSLNKKKEKNSKEADLKEKEKIIEVLKREIQYLKGSNLYLIGENIEDRFTSKILNEVYKEKSQNSTRDEKEIKLENESILEKENKNLSKKILDLENLKKNLEKKIEDLKEKLFKSKDFMKELLNEIDFYQKKNTLEENKGNHFDFKKTLENLVHFDKKLKDVYAVCIDLFVNLDKPLLVEMEKKLNDSIIEFKEIKDLLLNKI